MPEKYSDNFDVVVEEAERIKITLKKMKRLKITTGKEYTTITKLRELNVNIFYFSLHVSTVCSTVVVYFI